MDIVYEQCEKVMYYITGIWTAILCAPYPLLMVLLLKNTIENYNHMLKKRLECEWKRITYEEIKKKILEHLRSNDEKCLEVNDGIVVIDDKFEKSQSIGKIIEFPYVDKRDFSTKRREVLVNEIYVVDEIYADGVIYIPSYFDYMRYRWLECRISIKRGMEDWKRYNEDEMKAKRKLKEEQREQKREQKQIILKNEIK